MSVITKKPSAKFPVFIDFKNNQPGATAFTISSVSASATDSSGNTVTSTVLDTGSNSYSGERAQIWVQAGTAGQVYDVVVNATMTTGEIITESFSLEIETE